MQIRQAINLVSQAQDPTLHNIVNDIIQEAAPLAVHNKNFIVNNVPADLMIEANGAIISSVFNKLFGNVNESALRSECEPTVPIGATKQIGWKVPRF